MLNLRLASLYLEQDLMREDEKPEEALYAKSARKLGSIAVEDLIPTKTPKKS